ncbi:Protein CBG27117 [Caenorhabditis briggsae]|uniref:Protein CBG27117 n=1 Tax=Caenorhabditis briggsae TaxID=6238 RepID=B6IHJ1_CAEBR|nr:Protein CBG27117 [Caenorhabditis briggsae]CAR99371.1 Protein CBG27117 [Caenorhabditis briggsae]
MLSAITFFDFKLDFWRSNGNILKKKPKKK